MMSFIRMTPLRISVRFHKPVLEARIIPTCVTRGKTDCGGLQFQVHCVYIDVDLESVSGSESDLSDRMFTLCR